MGLADLHVHSIYSWDANSSIPTILDYAAKQAGLDVIAITDHDEIAGALKAEELARAYGVDVVPGTEISTAEGHLLALFVRQRIPRGRSLIETILRVGELGGLCVAPHPTARGVPSLSADALHNALRHPNAKRVLVGVEAFNASILHRKGNRQAEALALDMELALLGCSDAHVLHDIGRGATEFKGKTCADLYLALSAHQTQVGRRLAVNPLGVVSNWLPRIKRPAEKRWRPRRGASAAD